MALTPKILADGQLPAAKATLYTTPSSTSTAVKFFRLVNTTGGAITVNVYVKKSGGTSRRIIAKDHSLAAGAMLAVLEVGEVLSLSAGDVIEGDASAATSVDYVIDGGEAT